MPEESGKKLQKYTVQEGDSFNSIASAHGIEYWEDLWELNKDKVPNPDLLAPEDDAGQPVVLDIPDDRDHELGRKLLAEKTPNSDSFLQGTSWLDPRALFSQTYVDDDGNLLDGLKVLVKDPVLGKEHKAETKEGQVQLRLPRKEFDFRVELFPGFDEKLGWFNERVEPGDVLETLMAAPPASEAQAPAESEKPSPNAGKAAPERSAAEAPDPHLQWVDAKPTEAVIETKLDDELQEELAGLLDNLPQENEDPHSAMDGIDQLSLG